MADNPSNVTSAESDEGPDAADATPRTAERFRIRSIFWSVYVPTFLLGMGQGVVLAAIPLFAKQLGAGFGLIGIAAGAHQIGNMVFDIPAGVLVSRFGHKSTMVAGTLGLGLLGIGAGLSTSVFQFIAIRFVFGGGMALWSISRQTYVAGVVPVQNRGRALSLFGGVNRVAQIAGPAAGGAMALIFGLRSAFFIQGSIGLLTGILVIFVLEGTHPSAVRGHGAVHTRLLTTLRDRRHDFGTAGLSAVALQFIRNGRQTIIPLWGNAIGLDVAMIGNVLSISSVVDSLMFYPVGMVMDAKGRKWVLVPSLIVLSGALFALPFTTNFAGLAAVGVLAGFGNGLGSGIVFTLGVDLAPDDNTGEFLGVWRLITDSGGAAGPFAIGWIAQAVSLAAASISGGFFGLAGATVAFLFVRETLVKSPRSERTKSG